MPVLRAFIGLSFVLFLALTTTVQATGQSLIYPLTNQRFSVTGEGEPTVIILYGLASSMQEWKPMARRLSSQTRVFVY